MLIDVENGSIIDPENSYLGYWNSFFKKIFGYWASVSKVIAAMLAMALIFWALMFYISAGIYVGGMVVSKTMDCMDQSIEPVYIIWCVCSPKLESISSNKKHWFKYDSVPSSIINNVTALASFYEKNLLLRKKYIFEMKQAGFQRFVFGINDFFD